MMIEFESDGYECRFFDRFDEKARAFEDRLRGEPLLVGTIPWPRVSFWQGYRHLQSLSGRYFVLQMTRTDSRRAHQMAVVEKSLKIPFFKIGTAAYWVPAAEPDSSRDQAKLLEVMRELCLKRTSLMSLRVHCYIPDESALNAAQELLRASGFVDCDRQTPARTRLIDLSPSIEEVLAQFPTKVRTKLKVKKPEEVGVQELKSREQIPELQAALNDSFSRSTDEQYRYDFESLFKTLENSPEAAAAFGFYLAEEPNSPKAFTTGVGSAPLFEYTLAGSRSNARLRQFPFNYILLWKLVEAAKARGARVFDMGGITDGGPDDPLAGISDFKRRFPGFEVGIGREMLFETRPLRCRLLSLLQSIKGVFRKRPPERPA